MTDVKRCDQCGATFDPAQVERIEVETGSAVNLPGGYVQFNNHRFDFCSAHCAHLWMDALVQQRART